MVIIYSPVAFIVWAERKYGEDWYKEQSIINVYSENQLRDLYPHLYTAENIFNLSLEFNKNIVKLNNERLMFEANGIYNNPNTRKNRTLQEVINSTEQGHILEQFLIDNHNFIDNQEKYMDLISPCGSLVDCKTIKKEYLDNNDNYYSNMIKFMNDKNYTFKTNVKYVIVYSVKNDTYTYEKTLLLN